MVKEGKIKLNSRSLTDFQASIVSNNGFCVGVPFTFTFRNIIFVISITIRPKQMN